MRILSLFLLFLAAIIIGCNDNPISNSVGPQLSATNSEFEPSTIQVTLRSNVENSRTFQLKTVEWDGISELESGVAYEVGPDKLEAFKTKISESSPNFFKETKVKETNSPVLAVTTDTGDNCYAFVNATNYGVTIITEAQNTCYGDKVHRHYWQYSGGGGGYYSRTDLYGVWSLVETSKSGQYNYWWCRGVLERWGWDYYVDTDPYPMLACRVQLPKPYPLPPVIIDSVEYEVLDYVMYELVRATEEYSN
jgi:hypothetical protein